MTHSQADDILHEAESLAERGVSAEEMVGVCFVDGHETVIRDEVWLSLRAITIGLGLAWTREQERREADAFKRAGVNR